MLHGLKYLCFVAAAEAGLWIGERVGCGVAIDRHLHDFRQVEGVAGRGLGDLLAATEAVGDDQPVGRGVADGGEKFEFADGDRQVVLVFIPFEAEGACHAAAAGGGAAEVDAQAVQDGLFRRHLHEGLVVAVSVEERFAVQLGQWDIRGEGF